MPSSVLICGAPQLPHPILQVRSLTKEFAGFKAVDGVSLAVKAGTVHALIGPNGAGKTTLFNLISKFITPSSGQIFFKARDVTNLGPAALARAGIVRSFQISATFPTLTLLENVRLALIRGTGVQYHFWRSADASSDITEKAINFLEMVGLADIRNQTASELAYGRKRALELVTTLALEPEILLLDEPTSGLGHEDIGPITDLIKKSSERSTIVLVEHNLKVVEDLADTVTVLARGRILAEGTYSQIAKDAKVVAAYLGRQSERYNA